MVTVASASFQQPTDVALKNYTGCDVTKIVSGCLVCDLSHEELGRLCYVALIMQLLSAPQVRVFFTKRVQGRNRTRTVAQKI